MFGTSPLVADLTDLVREKNNMEKQLHPNSPLLNCYLLLRKLVRRSDAQDLIEYGILVAILSVALVGTIASLGGRVSTMYESLNTILNGGEPGGGNPGGGNPGGGNPGGGNPGGGNPGGGNPGGGNPGGGKK